MQAAPFAAAALVDRGDRGVECLEPRHDAVRQPVGALDERSLCPNAVPGDADAAGELREAGDVGVALVDALEAVLGRVEQVTRRHLRVACARVEQRGARRQVRERRHQVVEPHGFVGVRRKATGDTEEEVLRRLGDLAGLGVAQEVPVVDGPESEELELAVAIGVDRGVERGALASTNASDVVADRARRRGRPDRLGEPRDVLVAHLFVDVVDRRRAASLE